MNKKSNMGVLIYLVFVDSLGWGIAFSVFAALFFNDHSKFLPESFSSSARYAIYESLLAVYSLFMFFFAPVLGGVADRYGRKPALQISMMGLTFGFILSVLGCLWTNIWLLLIGRIISGGTAGSLSVAQAAAIDISTPKTKSYYLSILMLSNCLGFSLGPVLGGALLNSTFGPVGTNIFLIGAGMSLLAWIGVVFFFKESYLPAISKKPFNFLHDFLNIKIAFSMPILKTYLYSMLFTMVAFGLFFSDIPVFLNRQLSTPNSTTGIILSVEAVLFSFALMLGGKYIIHRLNNSYKTLFVIGAQALQLMAYLVLSISLSSLMGNVVLFTVISMFAGLMYIGLLTLISDATESDWQGRVMGVVAALSSVTWGVGPLLSGALNHYDSRIVFIFCASIMLIGLVPLSILRVNGFSKKTESIDLGSTQ